GQHIGSDNLLLTATATLRTFKGALRLACDALDNRNMKFNAETRIKQRTCGLSTVAFTSIAQLLNNRLQSLVLTFTVIILKTRRGQAFLGCIQAAQAFMLHFGRNELQITTGLEISAPEGGIY